MNYDIASVWIVRPEDDAATSPFRDGVRAINTSVNPPRWAVRVHDGSCLSKECKAFILEMRPSERDDEFYSDCRWDSLDEAIAFATELIPSWRAEEARRMARIMEHQAKQSQKADRSSFVTNV